MPLMDFPYLQIGGLLHSSKLIAGMTRANAAYVHSILKPACASEAVPRVFTALHARQEAEVRLVPFRGRRCQSQSGLLGFVSCTCKEVRHATLD